MSDAALAARREQAARRVATLTFDLGGLTAEMVNAGQFRLDVLTRLGTELRVADTELAELDRQLASVAPADVLHCPQCSADVPADAAFCARCGGSLSAG